MKNIGTMLCSAVLIAVASGCAGNATQTDDDVATESAELEGTNAWGILFYPIAIPFDRLDAQAVRVDKDHGYGKFHGFKKSLGTDADGSRLKVECQKPDVGPASCEIFGAGRIRLKDPTRAPLDSGERTLLTSTLVGPAAAQLSRSLPAGNATGTKDFSLACVVNGASCTLSGVAVYAGDSKF